MTIVIDYDHEDGTLNEWEANMDATEVTAAAAAALAGTNYGMQVVIDDTAAAFCYRTGLGSATGLVRARLYIDINSITMSNNTTFNFFYMRDSTPETFCVLTLRRSTVPDYRFLATIYNDAGAGTSQSTGAVSDAPHYIEVLITRSTNADSNNASLRWWVDGVEQTASTSIDCYNRFGDLDLVGMGAVSALVAGTSGTFYLDELVVNDDGSEIGPYVAGETKSLTDTGSGNDALLGFHLLNQSNFPLTPLLDNFNRTELLPNWSKYSGTAGNPAIVNNQFAVTGTYIGVAWWRNGNFGPADEFYWDINGLTSVSGCYFELGYNRYGFTTDEALQYISVTNLKDTSVRLKHYYYYLGLGDDVLVADSGDVSFSSRSSIRVGVRTQLGGKVNLFLDRGNGWENVASGTITANQVMIPGHLRFTLANSNTSVAPWVTADNFGGGNLSYPSIFVDDSLGDSGRGIDNPNLAALLGLYDLALGGDLLNLSALLSLLDRITAIDTTSISASVPVIDIGRSSESISLSAVLSLNDTGTGLDNISVSIAEAIVKLISDVASALDNVNISASLFTIDTSTGRDALFLSVSFSLIDTAHGVDSPELSASLSLNDLALGGDLLNLFASLGVADTSIGADTINVLQALFKSILDTGIGSDSVTTQAQLYISDVGTGESIGLTVILTLNDFGYGSDEITVAKLEAIIKTITDAGVALENINISAILSTNESGSGSDTTDISVSFSLSDTGTGIDSPELSVVLNIPDLALGGDLLDLLASLSVRDNITIIDATSLSASMSVGDVGVGSDDAILTVIIVGSTVWGHQTDVLEDNIRTFATNWAGTGSTESTGDDEKLVLGSGQYMISEMVQTGITYVTLIQNHYSAGCDNVLLQYRHGATQEDVNAASWNNYTVPFESLGIVQVRVESTL